LKSPREAGETVNTPMAIEFAQPRYALSWTYPRPLPRAMVEFDIERFDGQRWIKEGSTNQPPWPINTDTPTGFYRVGSHRKAI